MGIQMEKDVYEFLCIDGDEEGQTEKTAYGSWATAHYSKGGPGPSVVVLSIAMAAAKEILFREAFGIRHFEYIDDLVVQAGHLKFRDSNEHMIEAGPECKRQRGRSRPAIRISQVPRHSDL